MQTKIAGLAGAILFGFFSFFDLYLVPQLFFEFLLLRVVLGWSIILFTLITVTKITTKSHSQPIIATAVTIIAMLNISFIIIANPVLNSHYYIGFILIYFWLYSFLKLRYIWASLAGSIIFLSYLLTATFILQMETKLYIISISYLFVSNLAGMGISYALEFYSRKNYYQNLLLEKSLFANHLLNEKINESDLAFGEAEKKLTLQSQALEAAANSIIIFERDGTIVWCNQAFLNLTGYNIEELIGQNPRILKSGKHDKLFYKNLWSTILRGKVWSGEIVNRKKNGDLYNEEMIITPVINKNTGKVSHFISIKQDISLRKEMEEVLFDSEKRLRSFVENATVGIYRTNLEGKILMVNSALLKMLGFKSLETFQNRDLVNTGYVNKSQRDEFIKRLKQNGKLIGFESEWKKEDGSIIFIRESARLDYDENGQIIFEGTVEDISLSKFAEIELRESSKRLQTVIDSVYDAIFIHDTSGKIIDVNNKVLDLYNISREEALSLQIDEISSSENNFEDVKTYWNNVINFNKTFKFEWKAMTPKDKYVFDVEVFLTKITLGKKDFVLANVRDITDQKEANKKLLITQKAVELNASPICWISKEAKFVYVNNAAIKMLGYSFQEFLEMRLFDVDTVWTQNYWEEFVYPLLKEEKITQLESIHKNKNGDEIPIEVSASIINYENQEFIIAIINDITERKKIAESLIEAKEKAEQSDKLKSDFLAGMSHEIRTPINTILNFISLIKSDLGSDISEDINESFAMIDSGSRRLIRTIDSIINMSQLQSGIFELNLAAFSIVEDVLIPLMKEHKKSTELKDLTFDLQINTTDVTVEADVYTITQLFNNIIENAIKYTRKGGIKIIIDSDKDFLIVNITDSGIGISEQFLPTLFEPFLQEEMGYTRSYEGNGLGLALVKKYLDLNNGEIEVISEKEAGSSFIVKLNKRFQKKVNSPNNSIISNKSYIKETIK